MSMTTPVVSVFSKAIAGTQGGISMVVKEAQDENVHAGGHALHHERRRQVGPRERRGRGQPHRERHRAIQQQRDEADLEGDDHQVMFIGA